MRDKLEKCVKKTDGMLSTVRLKHLTINSMADINMKIKRKSGKTTLSFKVDKEITALFRDLTDNTVRESDVWGNMRFFYLSSEKRPENYNEQLRSYNLFDNFGQELVQQGRFNIAWIRAVDGEGEIEVPSSVTIAQVQQWVSHTARFLKNYFEENMRDYEVRGKIEVNI